jgi:hypothetical protein
VEAAAGGAVALAADATVGAVVGAAAGAVVGLAAAGGVVGAGAAGALVGVAAGALHAARTAETIGNPRPTMPTWRSARRRVIRSALMFEKGPLARRELPYPTRSGELERHVSRR